MEVRPREKRKCFCMLIMVVTKLDGLFGLCKGSDERLEFYLKAVVLTNL